MLRQLSINLDYFLINNNIFSNKKIMLLQARFPFTGFTLFIYLLTEIYSSHGYYAKLTVDDFEIIAIKFGIDKEEMIKILNFFFDYEMFDKKIYKKYAVLTSKGIQERYLSAKLKGRFINCMISKQLICLNLDFVLKNLAQRNNSETSKTRYNEYLEKIQYENTLEVAPALTDLSLLVRNTRKELMLHLPKQKRTSKVQNVTSDCNINEMPDVQNANINEMPDVQNVTSQCNNFGTIQDKTRQDKTRQDKTIQDIPQTPLKGGYSENEFSEGALSGFLSVSFLLDWLHSKYSGLQKEENEGALAEEIVLKYLDHYQIQEETANPKMLEEILQTAFTENPELLLSQLSEQFQQWALKAENKFTQYEIDSMTGFSFD